MHTIYVPADMITTLTMTLTLTLTFQMLLFEQHQIWENYSECQVWDCWRVTLTTFNLGGVLTNLFLQTFAEVTVMSLLFVADFFYFIQSW